MPTLEDRKAHLLQIIQSLPQEAWVSSVERFVNELLRQDKAYLYARPWSAKLNLAALAREQNYQKANLATLFGALEEDEPFEELRQELSA
jgi:hypothetical protein